MTTRGSPSPSATTQSTRCSSTSSRSSTELWKSRKLASSGSKPCWVRNPKRPRRPERPLPGIIDLDFRLSVDGSHLDVEEDHEQARPCPGQAPGARCPEPPTGGPRPESPCLHRTGQTQASSGAAAAASRPRAGLGCRGADAPDVAGPGAGLRGGPAGALAAAPGCAPSSTLSEAGTSPTRDVAPGAGGTTGGGQEGRRCLVARRGGGEESLQGY